MKSPLEQAVWKSKILFHRYITEAKAGNLNSQELSLHYIEVVRLTVEELTPVIPDSIAAKECLVMLQEGTKTFLDTLPFDGADQALIDQYMDNNIPVWVRAMNWLLTDEANGERLNPQAIFTSPYEPFPTLEDACVEVSEIVSTFATLPREVEDWDKELSDVTDLIYDKLYPSLPGTEEIISSFSLLLKANFQAVEDKLLSSASDDERSTYISDIKQTWDTAIEYFKSNPIKTLTL